jgi:ABC-2 type transport system permease protein
VYALFRKELADHLDSVRFLIVLALSFAIAGVSMYSALGGISNAVLESNTAGFVFLRLFVTSNGSIPSFVYFIALVGPLIGLMLGFDAINSEKNAGTLNRLLAQPIYRDDVINGKFLAGLVVVSIIVISMTMLVAGIGLFRIGVPPSGEEVVRLIVFVLFTIIYISFWLGLSILLSAVTRNAATSALSVVAVWLIMGFFIGLIATGLAGALFPQDNSVEMAEGFAAFQQSFSRISPAILYNEATATILDPSMRTLGITTVAQYQQMSVAAVGVLPLGQSLLLVWPHLIGMIAEMVAAFVIAYIVFMKQEIRGA